MTRLVELTPGTKGLDVGCGSEARDVYRFFNTFEVYGMDILRENLKSAAVMHPEIVNRLLQADLGLRLPFSNSAFDFVICSCVIQHLSEQVTFDHVLPELARVLKKEGVLYFVYKEGNGIREVFDPVCQARRLFQLYKTPHVTSSLIQHGFSIIEGDDEHIGGIQRFNDVRGIPHVLLYARKEIHV